MAGVACIHAVCNDPACKSDSGVDRIAKERWRQINSEGWSRQHDDHHVHGELAAAALAYVYAALVKIDPQYEGEDLGLPPNWWPWDDDWWKPSNVATRDLERAGALIAAELDRLGRLL